MGDPRAGQWVMPDVVGRDLQDAQDVVQRVTGLVVMVTKSHDASGQGRSQVFDRNWRVCTQNFAPGAEITERSAIDFGAVREDETCPS